jgi:gamma-glutamyltranspeptidase/glutathione hydrolase
MEVRPAQMLDPDYLAARARLIDRRRAQDFGHGTPPKAGTVYLTAADTGGMMVSLIQSNYMGFGSGIVVPGTGISLQNRGTGFSLQPGHANRVGPGKRPFHTIIPAFVMKDGAPWLSFGVMGGDMQPQGHVEVLCNLIDFKMDVQSAGEAPRLEHLGSATPTGRAAAANGGMVQAEPGIPDSLVAELERRGHHVQRIKTNGGGYQGILIDPKTNVLQGGSEARKDGCAVGY